MAMGRGGGTIREHLIFLLEALWFLFFQDYASFGFMCLYTGVGVKCRLGGQSCRRPLVSSEDSVHGATGWELACKKYLGGLIR